MIGGDFCEAGLHWNLESVARPSVMIRLNQKEPFGVDAASLKKFNAFVVIRHRIAEAITKFFGVCLVSVIGEHQRD